MHRIGCQNQLGYPQMPGMPRMFEVLEAMLAVALVQAGCLKICWQQHRCNCLFCLVLSYVAVCMFACLLFAAVVQPWFRFLMRVQNKQTCHWHAANDDTDNLPGTRFAWTPRRLDSHRDRHCQAWPILHLVALGVEFFVCLSGLLLLLFGWLVCCFCVACLFFFCLSSFFCCWVGFLICWIVFVFVFVCTLLVVICLACGVWRP